MESEITLPVRIQEWIDDGGHVRKGPDDLLAGLCGAQLARGASEGDGGEWCHRGAGEGTDHKRIGRCWQHEDADPSVGLPPWVGELDDATWKRLTGGADRPGEVRHGAHSVPTVRKTFEEHILAALPQEDQSVFSSINVEPVTIIDQEIKLNRVMATRVWRYLRRLQQVHDLQESGPGGRGRRTPAMIDAEHTLIRLSGALSRLMEVRVRYSELAEERSRDDFLAEMLSEMPAEDFREAVAKPAYLQKFLDRNQGALHNGR